MWHTSTGCITITIALVHRDESSMVTDKRKRFKLKGAKQLSKSVQHTWCARCASVCASKPLPPTALHKKGPWWNVIPATCTSCARVGGLRGLGVGGGGSKKRVTLLVPGCGCSLTLLATAGKRSMCSILRNTAAVQQCCQEVAKCDSLWWRSAVPTFSGSV